jgi:hypothetical protein
MDKSVKALITFMKKWFKNKMTGLAFALSNVEKNILTSEKDVNLTKETQRHTKGHLADSLINAEITDEVKNLRWRTYKILRHSKNLTAKIIGYGEDGMPIVETSGSIKNILNKIKIDEYDSYELEMVVNNSEITNSVESILQSKEIKLFEEPVIHEDSTKTHGTITGNEYFAINKAEKRIQIFREYITNFNIETYTTKLNIRKIDKNKKLLEFYISKYPNEEIKNSKLFLKELVKLKEKPKKYSLLDINKVSFITENTLGVDDYLKYEYQIETFDKIIEFDGFYVVKFIATITENGTDILDVYKEEELEKKYQNKEKKKTK